MSWGLEKKVNLLRKCMNVCLKVKNCLIFEQSDLQKEQRTDDISKSLILVFKLPLKKIPKHLMLAYKENSVLFHQVFCASAHCALQ